jgi:Flp pilus assembly secretin CpaC
MARRTLPVVAAVIGAAAFLATESAADMHVISSDATAQFLPLEISKSIVIDLPRDVADVLVTAQDIVNVIPRTNRQVSVIAKGLGQTNVYLFDANGKQIEGFDITVVDYPVSARAPRGPAQVVVVFRGSVGWKSLSCRTPAILAMVRAVTAAKTRRQP